MFEAWPTSGTRTIREGALANLDEVLDLHAEPLDDFPASEPDAPWFDDDRE